MAYLSSWYREHAGLNAPKSRGVKSQCASFCWSLVVERCRIFRPTSTECHPPAFLVLGSRCSSEWDRGFLG